MKKPVFVWDGHVEGVFYIRASSRDILLKRTRILEETTGFSDGGFNRFEEDDDGGFWKVITTYYFESIDEVYKAMKRMEKYSWFWDDASALLINGKEIFSDGKWLDDRIKELTSNYKPSI